MRWALSSQSLKRFSLLGYRKSGIYFLTDWPNILSRGVLGLVFSGMQQLSFLGRPTSSTSFLGLKT